MDHIEEIKQDKQINDVVVGMKLTVVLGTPVDGLEPSKRRKSTGEGFLGLGMLGGKRPLKGQAGSDSLSDDADSLGLMGDRDDRRMSPPRKKSFKTKNYLLPCAGVMIVVLLVVGSQLQSDDGGRTVSSDIAQLAPAAQAVGKAQAQQELQTDEPGKVVPDSVMGRVAAPAQGSGSEDLVMPQGDSVSVDTGALPKGLTPPTEGMSLTPAMSENVTTVAKVEPPSKTHPQLQPQSAAHPPAQSVPVDKNSSSMDVPLTGDSGPSADIASLKQSGVSKTAPSPKLAKPLEEVRLADKPESKPVSKPEAGAPAKQTSAAAGAAQKTPLAINKPEVVKPSEPKQVAVAKPEKPKLEAKPRLQELNSDRTKAKPARNALETDDTWGFALPIRELHANGRPVAPAQTPTTTATKPPAQYAEPRQSVSRGGTSVEVVHVESGYALVTNPNSQLPMRVSVGGTLPNGAVVNSFDAARGVIYTNRGSYGMN